MRRIGTVAPAGCASACKGAAAFDLEVLASEAEVSGSRLTLAVVAAAAAATAGSGALPWMSMISREGLGRKKAEYSLTSLTSSTTRTMSLENCAARIRSR